MAYPKRSRRVFLSEHPKGYMYITETTFNNENADLPTPKADEVVARVDYVSLDPAMRIWLNGDVTYVPPVQIGDLVGGTLGWAEYVIVPTQTLRRVAPPEGFGPVDYLGSLGTTGMTAYFGLLEVGRLTLVVTTAAGVVGSLVCQIGKLSLRGARVVAIASGPKCVRLTNDLGVDAALDYKSSAFANNFCETVGRLDVFFDNVGGEILDLALTRLNKGARVVLCGTISTYNADELEDPEGVKNYSSLIMQRAEIRGFVVYDYKERYGEAEANMIE